MHKPATNLVHYCTIDLCTQDLLTFETIANFQVTRSKSKYDVQNSERKRENERFQCSEDLKNIFR